MRCRTQAARDATTVWAALHGLSLLAIDGTLQSKVSRPKKVMHGMPGDRRDDRHETLAAEPEAARDGGRFGKSGE